MGKDQEKSLSGYEAKPAGHCRQGKSSREERITRVKNDTGRQETEGR